jgi:Asp-tRNA(Asn)/Glu-tRNA(Gln) amidotransferase A subunit family amidase
MRKKIWTFSKTARSVFCFLLITILFGLFQGCGERPHKNNQAFQVLEASIKEIHKAYLSGEITCQELVQTYLSRIEKYDKDKKLNSFVTINPKALTRASELDEEFQKTKKLRPLHGIPVIVKDNYDTHDLQTTAGSETLEGYIPLDDAHQVKALREAGAIVLAKSNMAEWAFSPYETLSSIAGITRNPYDLSRVPAGSSGGTAAAVAANFGTVGLGTDTGNSIRGPSAHCCLVGIRSAMLLTSRDGIVPLYR